MRRHDKTEAKKDREQKSSVFMQGCHGRAHKHPVLVRREEVGQRTRDLLSLRGTARLGPLPVLLGGQERLPRQSDESDVKRMNNTLILSGCSSMVLSLGAAQAA